MSTEDKFNLPNRIDSDSTRVTPEDSQRALDSFNRNTSEPSQRMQRIRISNINPETLPIQINKQVIAPPVSWIKKVETNSATKGSLPDLKVKESDLQTPLKEKKSILDLNIPNWLLISLAIGGVVLTHSLSAPRFDQNKFNSTQQVDKQ
jgi:hypothetical protein